MMSYLLAPFLLVFNVCFVFLNTAISATLISIFGFMSWIIPMELLKRNALRSYKNWGRMHAFQMKYFVPCKKEIIIANEIDLDLNHSYILASNHISWLDIMLISSVIYDKIPMPRFFLKKSLLWVPFVGMACKALDMIFVERLDRKKLLKNPKARNIDLETTRKQCEKYKGNPVTIINFAEGTRFTTEKQIKRKSTYTNLLPPKAGGIAYIFSSMGEQFYRFLDTSIVYPHKYRAYSFLAFYSGLMPNLTLKIDSLEIPKDFYEDQNNDSEYRKRFQVELNHLWKKKDQLLSQSI